ncbi:MULTISPECIES: fimbrial biogenesis chaperone [Dyella]|uniref:Molecular chaperone n=2 Tax=Dyella TaxID=231454 RepID=A0A4R0YQA1_9GAMM|nr:MULTISPECIES: fimbria/pilus periplasmic chaperone [Dyella]TBR36906.1 hypothetical protein EYV96_13475 [Dyella terrae]TCI08003.1 hypothetical protein EZM97_25395 [Dyella soli]
MSKRLNFLAGIALSMLASLVAVTPARAGVVMNGTRFIYASTDKEITVKVTNEGKVPVLVQSWIDEGDYKSTPESSAAPFGLTPPIARLDVGRAQTLRISALKHEFARDRETQYWLNVLEVSSRQKDLPGEEQSRLEFSFRYRLKLLYRPSGLPGSAGEAPSKLVWKLADGQLTARNDTPYHVTLNSLALASGQASMALDTMAIAPFSSRGVPVKGAMPAHGTGAVKVDYHSIDDWGAFIPHSKPLER